MTGSNWNWFGAKQFAANYVGVGTDGVSYSDWRLPTKAEYAAAIADGSFGHMTPFSSYALLWTSQSKGFQQSWCAKFLTGVDGVPPAAQTVQYVTSNSTYSGLGATFVRP